MRKIINGTEYYIPANLTSEQEKIYCHIIDWKREHITKKKGVYRGNEYDAVLPVPQGGFVAPAMIYELIALQLTEMQQGEFAYKPHKFAHHAVSSQTACINLFMPLLLSDEINSILPKIQACPPGFKEIARDKLFNGFSFEYWGQDIKSARGVLNDHSMHAGTDADVAIAYYDIYDRLCLWIIEHKLTEKKFTECGAYRSKANKQKKNCRECDLADIVHDPDMCYYHKIKRYKYWDLLKPQIEKFKGKVGINGCPFRLGMNQLWRNQILAFALEETGVYKRVTFSVCHHARNSMLRKTINQYETLICNSNMFGSFTNYDVLNAIDDKCADLQAWKQWYKDVYCF